MNAGAHLSSKTPDEQFGKEVQSLHCHSERGLNFSEDEHPQSTNELAKLKFKKGFQFFAHDLKGSCAP